LDFLKKFMKELQYSFLEKAKMVGVALVTGLASLVSGADVSDVNNPDLEALQNLTPKITAVSEVNTEKQETRPEEKKPIEFYAETTFATNYVFGSGAVIGKKNPKKPGGVNQTLLSATKPLKKGSLTGYIWTSFDFQDAETGNGFHELDFGSDYALPVTENLSATVGYGSWNYPSEFLGAHGDHMIHGKLSYKGVVDIEGGLIHLLDYEDVDNGEFYFGKISKTFPIGKIGERKVSFTPSLGVGHTDNFYGQYGLATLTPGADFAISNKKGDPFCNLFVRFQDGKNSVDDLVYGGITFPISFGKKE